MKETVDASDCSEIETIKLVLAGNTEAFNMIVTKFWPRVHVLIRNMLRANPDSVDDLCQETFLAAFTKLYQFDIERNFLNWLLRIASNMTMQYFRKNKRNPGFQYDDEREIESKGQLSSDPANLIEDKATWDYCLANLSEHARIIVILRHWIGFSYAEIADLLQEPVGTIRSSLHSSRKKLRVYFDIASSDSHTMEVNHG